MKPGKTQRKLVEGNPDTIRRQTTVKNLPCTASVGRGRDLKLQKGVPVHTPKLCKLEYPSPMSTRSKCVNWRSKRVKASGPDAPSLIARNTCPKTSSIRVVMLAVVGLSGLIARVNAFCSERSQPGTHADRRSSVQRSSLLMRMSDMAALTDRVNCCAPLALFKDAGKGRAEM